MSSKGKWGCLPSVLYKTDAVEVFNVFFANDKHDIGRRVLSRSK